MLKPSVVEWLMQHGCNMDTEECPEHAALTTACEHQAFDILEDLIKGGLDINSVDHLGETAFMSVIKSASFTDEETVICLKQLSKQGADVNVKDKNNNSALLAVCWNGKTKVVEYLVDEVGMDVNETITNHGITVTPIHMAMNRKHLDIVRCLLERNVDLQIDVYYAEDFFVYACRQGCVEVVVLLLDRGMDYNINNGDPIDEAIANDRKDVLQVLINAGYKGPLTPECLDAGLNFKNKTETLEFLLDRGVEFDHEYLFGIAVDDGNINLMEKLVNLGVDVKHLMPKSNYYGIDSMPLLVRACACWQLESAEWLIKHGADVNVMKGEYQNGLMYACNCLDGSIAKLLIDRGVDINVKNKYGRTALMYACENGSYETVKLLVEKNVDLNVQDEKGETALMSACKKKDLAQSNIHTYAANFESYDIYGKKQDEEKLKIIDLLLEKGAEIDIQNNDGQSATFYALKNADIQSCTQKLVKAGANLELRDKNGNDIFSIVLQRVDMTYLLRVFFNSGKITTKDGRLKPNFRFNKNLALKPTFPALKELMRLEIFEWELTQIKLIKDMPFMLQYAIDNGICPGRFTGYRSHCDSPLVFACREKDVYFKKVIIKQIYFYPEDYRTLCSEEFKISSGNGWFFQDITHNPISLFTWSFINISKAISLTGSPSSRQRRVKTLPIPDILKKRLNFAGFKPIK